jgi:GcrA cell cycle regulator
MSLDEANRRPGHHSGWLVSGNPTTQWKPGQSGNPAGRAAICITINNGHKSHWTEAVEFALREKWFYGKSCTIISRELNTEFNTTFTRNAVIGKVDRLNLPKRESKIRALSPACIRRRHDPKFRKPKAKAPTKPSYYQVQAQLDSEIPQEQRKTFLELGKHNCRWPVGQVGHPDFFFCGGQAAPKQSYCAGHCVRAYNLEYRRRAA